MLVVSQCNFLFRKPDENYLLKRGVLTSVPDWVAEEPWFKALCSAGQIAVSETSKDKDIEQAVEEAKAKKPKKKK